MTPSLSDSISRNNPQATQADAIVAAYENAYKAFSALLTQWNEQQGGTPTQEAADRLVQAQVIESIVQGYIQVSQTSLDRAVTRGTYVTTAAGAIATAYTALLAARFSSSAGATRLVAAALIPALFLGLGIVFSVAYIAFLKQASTSPPLLECDHRLYSEVESTSACDLDSRLTKFCNWTYGGVRDRSGYLHLSVYALAVGVALLPISFTQLSQGTDWLIALGGFVFLAIAAVALAANKLLWARRLVLWYRNVVLCGAANTAFHYENVTHNDGYCARRRWRGRCNVRAQIEPYACSRVGTNHD